MKKLLIGLIAVLLLSGCRVIHIKEHPIIHERVVYKTKVKHVPRFVYRPRVKYVPRTKIIYKYRPYPKKKKIIYKYY